MRMNMMNLNMTLNEDGNDDAKGGNDNDANDVKDAKVGNDNEDLNDVKSDNDNDSEDVNCNDLKGGVAAAKNSRAGS